MATGYTYLIDTHFTSAAAVDPVILTSIINANATVSLDVDYIEIIGNEVDIWFASALSGAQETELTAVVGAYTYTVPLSSGSGVYEVVVSTDVEGGDYTSVAAAFAAGASSVFVKSGTYVETADVIIPDGGQLIGEATGKVVLYFIGAYGVKIDGSGGVKEVAGTITCANATNQVTGVGTTFTNRTAGEWVLIGTNFFQIASIESATALTLAKTYVGATVTGANCLIQPMFTGNKVSNLAIVNSAGVGVGLYVRSMRHGAFSSLAIYKCAHNVNFIDSGDLSVDSLIIADSTGIGCTIDNCMSISYSVINLLNNVSHGIVLLNNCTNIEITSSATENSGGYGLHVAGTSNQINISGTVVRFNNAGGVVVDVNTEGVSINASTISDNIGNGVNIIGDHTVVAGCFIKNNTSVGLLVGTSSIISNTHIKNNTGDGLNVPTGKNGCIVSGNEISNNGGIGMNIIGDEGVFDSNILDSNTGNGATIAGSDIVVSGTLIKGNGGKGIYVTGNDNTISGSRVKTNTGNGIEVHTGATDNIVSSNNAKGNTGTNYIDNGTTTGASGNKT